MWGDRGVLPHWGDGEVERATEPQHTPDQAERPPHCTGPSGEQHPQGWILPGGALCCWHPEPPTPAHGGLEVQEVSAEETQED